MPTPPRPRPTPKPTRIQTACPNCGPAHLLIIRHNRTTGKPFLGCPTWPQCHYTDPLPTALTMEALSRHIAPHLPGF